MATESTDFFFLFYYSHLPCEYFFIANEIFLKLKLKNYMNNRIKTNKKETSETKSIVIKSEIKNDCVQRIENKLENN